MAEREERDDEAELTTEELMKAAPPPSVLGDVEDAVTPDVEGELTPWSPEEPDAAEREGSR
jgi:hypothetical protein